MVWFSHGPIVLSAALPAAVALLIWLLERRGPLAAFLQKPTGIVAPYFTCIAILFGMVTALLMSDVWQKDTAAIQSVQSEDDAVRALLGLSRVNAIETVITTDLKAYAMAAAKENPYSRANPAARTDTDRAYEALLKTLAGGTSMDSVMKARLLDAASDLRRARERRLYLTDDETVAIKWLSVLVLGALTQIALALVHGGNRSAIHVGVGLFAVAFTFCIVIIAVFDQPFELMLSDEPGATLNRTLKGL